MSLSVGMLSPVGTFAGQPVEAVVSENSAGEQAQTDDMTEEEAASLDPSEEAVGVLSVNEEEPALLPETLSGVITIYFYDEDGSTVLYGPIEKDLSAVRVENERGRYLFDTIDENGASVPDANGLYVLPYVHKGRRIMGWNRKTKNNYYGYNTNSLAEKARFTASDVMTPKYSNSNYKFDISYDYNGGINDPNSQIEEVTSFTIDSEPVLLPNARKKGYRFLGWQIVNPTAGDRCGQIISEIPGGTYVDLTYGDLQTGGFMGLALKAVYEKITVGTPALASLKNEKSGIVHVKITKPAEHAENISYELCYGTSPKFKRSVTHVVDLGTKTDYKITNVPKGKTYYFRVRGFSTDENHNRVYSPYSPVQSLKIKKGVSEIKRATGKSASLAAANVKIDADKNLYVTANVSKRLKSYDDFYYLVAIDPCSGKIIKAVADSDKNKTAVFKTPVRDEKGKNLINGKYAIAVKTGKKKYRQISRAYYISNPEAAADYAGAYPVTQSKKGIQGSLNKELGVQQGFMNYSINSIFADKSSGKKYVYNGKTYYFNEPHGAKNFAASCNATGITCTVQFMMNWPGTGKYNALLYGTKSAASPTNLYAINASTTKSREIVEAAFSFLAEELSRENCHVDNWILGNEVNIYDQWYYAGHAQREAFMNNYANSFRILYNSVKGRSRNARIFICTDHTWRNRSGDWGAKPFMESFNARIKSMNKNIQWNLAYHAYPAILYIPTTWNDSYAQSSENADFVTPKNLNVLTNHVKKTYGKNTRIIISEVGFTSAEGEKNQAAALAYSFYKAQFNDMIDAFIIRTEVDAIGEKLKRGDGTVINANFGLSNLAGKKRAAYNVFKYMDTPDYEKYTKDCLKTIGRESWKGLIPGFDDKKLKAMPRR